MFFDLAASDLATIGFLVFLEGVLSIDNALVLALIAGELPHDQQKRALSYGIIGAIIFRISAISFASFLLHWHWIKYLGGAYLIYLAVDYWRKDEEEQRSVKKRNFWMTVLVIELTDISFAVDSILTAVALTKKLSVVITGGVIGLIMMRFAASLFLKLMVRYPRFEPTAYILVLLIGVKLIIEAIEFPFVDFHSASNPAFWAFWGSMLSAFLFGFTGKKTIAK